MKVELIAKRAGRYGKNVKVGERFRINRTEGNVLVAVGYAYPAPPLPKPATAHKAPVVPKAREYLRRDMTAEDPRAVQVPYTATRKVYGKAE